MSLFIVLYMGLQGSSRKRILRRFSYKTVHSSTTLKPARSTATRVLEEQSKVPTIFLISLLIVVLLKAQNARIDMKNIEEASDSTRSSDESVSRPLGSSPKGPASLNKIVLHKGLDLTSARKGRKGLKKAGSLPNYAISGNCESISEGSSIGICFPSVSQRLG